MTNYTAAHESRVHLIGPTRLDYPDQHIESDNRLSWFLGGLDLKYGDEPFYVHLLRDKEQVCRSFMHRWSYYANIMKAFSHGVVMYKPGKMTPEIKYRFAGFYYDTVNDNIASFLRHKPFTMTMHLETIERDFAVFWERIGAAGDIDAALAQLRIKHNATSDKDLSHASIFQRIKRLARILRP